MTNLGIAVLLAASALSSAPEPVPAEQVTFVPAELQAQVRERIGGRGTPQEQRLQQLVDFVFSPDGLALQYGTDSTLTIEQAYQVRQANCLSFTLLFVALARQAGLDAFVQETDQVLAWFEEGGTVYNSGHVNVGVRIGRRLRTIDIDRSIVMVRHPPRAIGDGQALARFYNNRGAELMSAGRHEAAERHLEAAVRLDPGFAAAWNNLGVLRLRQGDPKAAENAYGVALQKDPDDAATLSNFVNLYARTGDHARLAEYKRRLHEAQLNDPFHQFLLAIDHEKRGDQRQAIRHYQRAIRLHPGEHRFYFGLARAYVQLGDHRRARRALVKARDVSQAGQRGVYQAKLDDLRAARR